MVSVGDSYISGEAGRWVGNSNTSQDINDWGAGAYFGNGGHWSPFASSEEIANCHRSFSADIHIFGEVGDSGFTGGSGPFGDSANLACSGATAQTVVSDGAGNFKPGLDFVNSSRGVGQALALRRLAAKHNVRMVVVSIGGNNFHFADIVAACVVHFLRFQAGLGGGPCKNDPAVTNNITGRELDLHTDEIRFGLLHVRQAMKQAGYRDSDYTILVQNYESPIPDSSGFRYSESPFGDQFMRQDTGGCGFLDADADWANSIALPTINNAVRNAILETDLTNVQQLDLSQALNGRRLCEKGVDLLEARGFNKCCVMPSVASPTPDPRIADETEWVHQILLASAIPGQSRHQLQESFHPNFYGQLALRSCVRQAYNLDHPTGGKCTIARPGLTTPSGTLQLAEPNMRFDPLGTAFDRIAEVKSRGRSVRIGGPQICKRGERATITVTLRQGKSVATGTWHGPCKVNGTQRWTIKRLTVKGHRRVHVGAATACAVRVAHRGKKKKKVFRWCAKPGFALLRGPR